MDSIEDAIENLNISVEWEGADCPYTGREKVNTAAGNIYSYNIVN